jgi:hypothetical protein
VKIRRKERRREERMRRDCNEEMWTNGHPFIRLSGPPEVTGTVTISAKQSLVSVGGRFQDGIHVLKAMTYSRNIKPLSF